MSPHLAPPHHAIYDSDMSNDDQAPASKQDIRLLMQAIGTFYDQTNRRLVSLEEMILASEERMKEHVDLAVETIRHDLLGANRDRVEDHEHRIVRLEQHAKLKAA
jgi:hypothetical protein